MSDLAQAGASGEGGANSPSAPQSQGAVPRTQPATEAPAAADRHPLVAELETWAESVAKLLDGEQRGEAASELRVEISRRRQGLPIVVVAGEDKRGKSSLINALLQEPGVSPVGVEVVTATPITLYKADTREAFVCYYGDENRYPANFEDAQYWATVEGNRGNQYNIRSIELGLVACPLLERITVWDTPGVGGLESGHAALTLQSLKEADALVFVLESGAQIRAEELKFLREASKRIDTVIFALTKVDVHRGWKQIMEDNRSILRDKAPRFAQAPMIPVSSKVGLLAVRAQGGSASALWEESGLQQLEKVILGMVAGKADQLRAANVVRAGFTPLMQVERQLRERSAALDSPEQAQATLAAEKTRLAELNRERAEWPMTMNTELRRLGLNRTEELSRKILELRSRYDERLKDVKTEDQDTLPGEFVADLTAIASQINEWTAERIVDLVAMLFGKIEDAAMIESSLRRVSDSGFAEELASIAMGDTSMQLQEKISVVQSYSSGHSLASLFASGGLGLSFVAAPVMLGVGVLLGGIMAFERFRQAKRTNFVQEFKRWMQEQCQRGQLAVTNTFQQAQIDLEVGIRDAMKSALAEREQEINEAIEACQAAMQQAESERKRQQRDMQPKIDAITALKTTGTTLLQKSRQAPAGITGNG